eukprot:scaffold181760_cov29-Tisochrysis_lutea.AAC.1
MIKARLPLGPSSRRCGGQSRRLVYLVLIVLTKQAEQRVERSSHGAGCVRRCTRRLFRRAMSLLRPDVRLPKVSQVEDPPPATAVPPAAHENLFRWVGWGGAEGAGCEWGGGKGMGGESGRGKGGDEGERERTARRARAGGAGERGRDAREEETQIPPQTPLLKRKRRMKASRSSFEYKNTKDETGSLWIEIPPSHLNQGASTPIGLGS